MPAGVRTCMVGAVVPVRRSRNSPVSGRHMSAVCACPAPWVHAKLPAEPSASYAACSPSRRPALQNPSPAAQDDEEDEDEDSEDEGEAESKPKRMPAAAQDAKEQPQECKQQ